MKYPHKFVLLALLVVNGARVINGEFEDILKLCDNGDCELDEEEFNNITESEQYNRRLYHLMTSGVPRILWDFVRENNKAEQLVLRLNISQVCANHLIVVNSGLDDAREWAYRCKHCAQLDSIRTSRPTQLIGFTVAVIDASAKTPPALFEATISSLGNYEECLAIQVPTGNDIAGKYCFPDLFPTRIARGRRLTPREREERANTGRVNLGDIR